VLYLDNRSHLYYIMSVNAKTSTHIWWVVFVWICHFEQKIYSKCHKMASY